MLDQKIALTDEPLLMIIMKTPGAPGSANQDAHDAFHIEKPYCRIFNS